MAAELRQRALSHERLPRLAETFLVNTRLIRGDAETSVSIQNYFSDVSLTAVATAGGPVAPSRGAVTLPPSAELKMEFRHVVARRRTVNSYTGDPMDLSHLATLVRAMAGVTGEVHAELSDGSMVPIHKRAAPSGGGLYPIDVYVGALRVRSLAPAFYRYQPQSDLLVPIEATTTPSALTECTAMSDDLLSLSRATAVFFMVGRPWRSMRKYGGRGMRLVFLEAGAMAQNLNLAAVALGYGSADYASFFDDEIHDVLNLDGLYDALIHSTVVGVPA